MSHCFISYSNGDADDFGPQLAMELEGGHQFVEAWFDKRDIKPGQTWDERVPEAIKTCKCLLFVMTKDSVAENSICFDEWDLALKYKKPILVLRLHKDAEPPFRLGKRQWIDFTGNHKAGMAKLLLAIQRLDKPDGQLDILKDRLADAERDLVRATQEDRPRIQAEIDQLKADIQALEKVIANPDAAAEQTQKNIEAGLERERKPEKPTVAESTTKFINPPPGVAPNYFQDRYIETEQIAKFLQDDSQRMMTIVGRGGVGKTAMACRLLKGLEGGELPDGLGSMKVEGIVYLSESGSHRVNFANLFYDLCKLLPADAANALDAVYKNPQASTASKMSALLDRFTAGKVVLLLDNVEPLISVETFDIADAELDECLRALLHGAHSALKVILTTRVAPRGLNLCEPGRQRMLTLDSGLEQKYAVEMLREMDVDGKLGLKSAAPEALKRAYERTLGFPRALEALFAILASDRYTTLDELLAMPTPENVVEALVGEAFNRLDTNAQKVMQALAVYNRPVPPAAVDYLLAPHIPAMDSAPILQRLANMHFARKESGRFYLHPVDRDFAYGLIPVGENREQRVESSDSSSQNLALRRLLSNRLLSSHLAFTQHDLLSRAADYFAQARKPRAEWKKLEDLSAQLAEFDLRCEAGDHDTAASVLSQIDDLMQQWGHYRLTVQLNTRILENIKDKDSFMFSLNELGWAYSMFGEIRHAMQFYQRGLDTALESKNRSWEGRFLSSLGSAIRSLGNIQKAIELLEEALLIAQEMRDRKGESVRLGNLGNRYSEIADYEKAIAFHEKAILIAQEMGDRRGESVDLENIGFAFLRLGDYRRASESFQSALQISDDISFSQLQQNARNGLAETYLLQDDLVNARITIEAALGYDVPENNHNVSALHGIILLRMRDLTGLTESRPDGKGSDEDLSGLAAAAFLRAIGRADEILSKTAEYYSALDAKGLALCGLAILDDGRRTMDDGQSTTDDGNGQSSMVHRQQAIETFRKARKIAPHAGIVKSVLRLFDELVKCDKEGILKEVRDAIAPTVTP